MDETRDPEVIEGEQAINPNQPQDRLTQSSIFLVRAFERDKGRNHDRGIAVNAIASELAAWYEKLRTAIENRDEEVILRAAIERILRRRLLLGGTGESVGMPLVRELVWARYFPDESIGEEKVLEVEQTIDLFLELRQLIPKHNKIQERELNDWIYHLLSADLEDRLSPSPEEEAMVSYIFHNVKRLVVIRDDTEEVRDVQTYIAIRKAYKKEDLALLRFALFNQYFGRLTRENLQNVAERFSEGKKVIDEQLSYSGRFKIFEFIKRQMPPFLILDDILKKYNGKFRDLIANEQEFINVITETCNARYANISSKVRRAIIRSIIFILLTKAFLALTIEGTYERLVYGHILWHVIVINIAIPVSMIILISFFIKAPGKDNTERIINRIMTLLYDKEPQLGAGLLFNHNPRAKSLLDTIFTIVWLTTYLISFGLIIYILTKIQFNPVSQLFFIFFFAIITFLSFRINQTAKLYQVKDKSTLLTPFVDFFFMPIARVGRYLAEGVSQVNIFVFILDMLIEMPLKALISFFEKWFSFLHQKREDLA